MFPVYSKIMNLILKAALTLLFIGNLPCAADQKPDVKVVEVEKATRTTITQTVRLIGTVQAKRSTILIAKTIGTLDHVAFAGQKISKGGVIAKLENADLDETYRLSKNAEKVVKEQY